MCFLEPRILAVENTSLHCVILRVELDEAMANQHHVLLLEIGGFRFLCFLSWLIFLLDTDVVHVMVNLVELNRLLVKSTLLFWPDHHGFHLYLSVLFISLSLLEIMLLEDKRIVLNVFLLFKNVGENIQSLLWCWTRALCSFSHVTLHW